MDELKKLVIGFVGSISAYLEKKRESRLNLVKREITYKKEIEAGEEQLRSRDEQIRTLKEEITKK